MGDLIEMKTLTIGGKRYEIVDENARSRISQLELKPHYKSYSVTASMLDWVSEGDGTYTQRIEVDGITDSDVIIDLDTDNIPISDANLVMSEYSNIWKCETFDGEIILTAMSAPVADIPLILGAYE